MKRHPFIAATMIRNLEVGKVKVSNSFETARMWWWMTCRCLQWRRQSWSRTNPSLGGNNKHQSRCRRNSFLTTFGQRSTMLRRRTLPTSRATKIDPQPFRLFLCRRPHLSHSTCRCGRQHTRKSVTRHCSTSQKEREPRFAQATPQLTRTAQRVRAPGPPHGWGSPITPMTVEQVQQ